jgi:hypothetical protein
MQPRSKLLFLDLVILNGVVQQNAAMGELTADGCGVETRYHGAIDLT